MRSFFLLPALCITILLRAQTPVLVDEQRFAFDPHISYDAAIPSPQAFLGYPLGQEMTLHAHLVQYFEKLAASSPKISLNTYGKTYEGRPLINVVISSQANMNRIEELRTQHLRLSDPDAISASEASQLIENQPVFLSMSYTIHGNEASSSEAVMQVAYRLIAAQDEATRQLLDRSVIVLYICINPDGRDRFAYWYKSVQRSIPAHEPADLEHSEPWPMGRTNHYWFDLNRDWFFMVNQESRAHSAEYQRWMPQVHADYHEQGYNSNYFTAPGTTPRNLLMPKTYEALTDTFGRANIREFEKKQVSYFTREVFDFFYPGYGSSYPGVLGAVSMLTEQGGIGGGRIVETEDGYMNTFRQRIWDHYATSMATLLKAGEMRKELLRYSFDAWNYRNSASPVKAYFLADDPDGYTYDAVSMLMKHGVRVERATADFSVDAMNYRSGKTERKTLPKGTFVIPAAQPRHLFLHSVMERNMAIEDSVMYDVSTWSVPLAFNLEAWATTGAWKANTEKLDKAPTLPSGLRTSDARYAYVIEWKQRHAPKALAALWEKGYRVRAAKEPFSDGRTRYGEGTLIVLLGHNLEKADRMAQDMAEIAASCQVNIHGHHAGRMSDGFDLASSSNRPVARPKVALMVDPPFDMYSCGQIYFLFDQETRLPVERIRTSSLRQTALPKFGARYGYADLNNYQVLILPNGGMGLREVFQKEQLDQLRAWVEAGGVLIAQEGAVPFFTDNRSKFTKVRLLETKPDTSSEQALFLPYAERSDYQGLKRVPGAALNATIDYTNPLAFGMGKMLYSLKSGTEALKADADFQTVGRYATDPASLLASGYASQENLKHLAGNAFAGVLPMGRGKVVFLLDNPQFRMYWRGPSRMMQNAVMLLPGF
ncbi:MAG TPA: M14 family metallopeptidase [Saprospiraceae bacterium]|nr:M14 family metallopeptidase [Saprospiraceae bacterium]